MLKATMHDKDGRRVLVLGLEQANVDRLRDGKPIRVDGRPWGLDIDIAIVFGQDSRELLHLMKRYITPPTRVHIDDKVQ